MAEENVADAVADSAQVHLIMLIKSGEGTDTQWFDYRVNFFQEPVRIEWDKGTMSVVLPAEAADHLIKNKYARPMTEPEIEDYASKSTAQPAAPEQSQPPKRRRGDQS